MTRLHNIPDSSWITATDTDPERRGPVFREFVPFVDITTAPSMVEMLRRIATEHADRVAVEENDASLTFRELFDGVVRLAAAITLAQPASGQVGILLPGNASYLVAVFSTLAAGRMAVLLDARFPDARNIAIGRQAGITLLLTDSGAAHGWADVPSLDVRRALDPAVPVPPLGEPALGLDAPAFILCTSGSSGQPKPIVYSQRTLYHWLSISHDLMHLRPDDRGLSLSSFSTLGGITGLLSYPLAGASLQVVDLKVSGLSGLLETLSARPVTILRAVPSTLRMLARLPGSRAAFAGLRAVMTYGEPLMKADLREIIAVLPAGAVVRYTYGSTESCGLSWFAGEPDDHDPFRVASGVLHRDVMAAIVDDDDVPSPDGQAGELIVRSRYNALGEWTDGELVAGRIVPHASGDGTRVYRTGDLARHRDGVFVVVGRKDRMMKVNGQRVEPAEIEHALRQVAGVAHAEIVLRPHATAPTLVAFVVPTDDAGDGFTKRLRAEVRRALPEYMVPSRFIEVAAIPMLPGGKVDTLALLAIADGAAMSSSR